jgi:hypothetical protein
VTDPRLAAASVLAIVVAVTIVSGPVKLATMGVGEAAATVKSEIK